MELRVQGFTAKQLKARIKQVTPLSAYALFYRGCGLFGTRALFVYLPHRGLLALVRRSFTAIGFYQNAHCRAAVSAWPGVG